MKNGIGYSVLSTIISLCGACGLRILWIVTIFNIDSFHNLFGLALSYPVSWLVTASVHFIFFLVFYKKTVKIYDLNYQTKTA